LWQVPRWQCEGDKCRGGLAGSGGGLCSGVLVRLVVWGVRGASLALRVSVCGKLWAAGNASGERAASSHPDTTIADCRNWFPEGILHGVRTKVISGIWHKSALAYPCSFKGLKDSTLASGHRLRDIPPQPRSFLRRCVTVRP